MADYNQPKPAPKTDDQHVAEECTKCGGTGFYCMGTENGRPYSHTGFTCYPCHGTGWKVVKKATVAARAARARRAEAKAHTPKVAPAQGTRNEQGQELTMSAGRKLQVAPYVYAVCPADGLWAIYDTVADFVADNRKQCQYVKGEGFVGLRLQLLPGWHTPLRDELVAKFNAGERWYTLPVKGA